MSCTYCGLPNHNRHGAKGKACHVELAGRDRRPDEFDRWVDEHMSGKALREDKPRTRARVALYLRVLRDLEPTPPESTDEK